MKKWNVNVKIVFFCIFEELFVKIEWRITRHSSIQYTQYVWWKDTFHMAVSKWKVCNFAYELCILRWWKYGYFPLLGSYFKVFREINLVMKKKKKNQMNFWRRCKIGLIFFSLWISRDRGEKSWNPYIDIGWTMIVQSQIQISKEKKNNNNSLNWTLNIIYIITKTICPKLV